MFGEVSKFVEKVETIEVGDLGDDGNEREFELWGACENNIVIKSDDRYNRDNYINLMVYNLVTKDTWRIGSIGPTVASYTSSGAHDLNFGLGLLNWV